MTPGTRLRSSVRSLSEATSRLMTSPPTECFRFSGVSRATILPWSMMATRSHRPSASSR